MAGFLGCVGVAVLAVAVAKIVHAVSLMPEPWHSLVGGSLLLAVGLFVVMIAIKASERTKEAER